MKRLVAAFLTLAFAVACDPGMAIRQRAQASTPSSEVSVSVATARPFIGSRRYAAKATVTNSSRFPITVTAVQLIVRGVTFENGPSGTENYPLLVPAGTAREIAISFRLRENVNGTLQEPADICVHYRTAAREDGVAQAEIIGGRLSD